MKSYAHSEPIGLNIIVCGTISVAIENNIELNNMHNPHIPLYPHSKLILELVSSIRYKLACVYREDSNQSVHQYKNVGPMDTHLIL